MPIVGEGGESVCQCSGFEMPPEMLTDGSWLQTALDECNIQALSLAQGLKTSLEM